MTFKEYIDRITETHTIFSVEEHCNARFVCMHLSFGFNEDDSEDADPQQKDDYVLYGTDGYETPTRIDSNQNVELKEKSVCVTDRDGNPIELNFFTASVIPHPTAK